MIYATKSKWDLPPARTEYISSACDKPVFYSLPSEMDGGCVEDPRLAKIGDLYYLTYAARAYAPGQYWLDG